MLDRQVGSLSFPAIVVGWLFRLHSSDPDREQQKTPRREVSVSPRDLTGRDRSSLGSTPVSSTSATWSRTATLPPTSLWLPPLPAEGLRTLVPASVSPGTLLQRYLPTEGTPLAALAGGTTVPQHRAGQGTPPTTEPTVPGTSQATPAGRSCHPAAARGPAPSTATTGFCSTAMPPARLL